MKTFKNYTNINEKVYGKLATVYHRTQTKDIIKNINKIGFQRGLGRWYGPGIYCTYNLKSQLNNTMNNIYGSLIIKSKVNLYGYLIFNKDIAKKVYKKPLDIEQQWKFLTNKPVPDIIAKNKIIITKYTSDLAQIFSKDINIRKMVDGIVFTGRQDGDVVVSYDESSVTPISYNSTINNPSVLDSPKWNRTLNKQLIAMNLNKNIELTNKGVIELGRDEIRELRLNKIKIKEDENTLKIINSHKKFLKQLISATKKGKVKPKTGEFITLDHDNYDGLYVQNAIIDDFRPINTDAFLDHCDIKYHTDKAGYVHIIDSVIHDCDLYDIKSGYLINENIIKKGNIYLDHKMVNIINSNASNLKFTSKYNTYLLIQEIQKCSFDDIDMNGKLFDTCKFMNCFLKSKPGYSYPEQTECLIKNSWIDKNCFCDEKLSKIIKLINCNITTEEFIKRPNENK